MPDGRRRRSTTPSARCAGARSTGRSTCLMWDSASPIAPPAIGRLRSRPAASPSKPIRASACLIFCAPPPFPSSAASRRPRFQLNAGSNWSPALRWPALCGRIPAEPRSGSRSARRCAGSACRSSAFVRLVCHCLPALWRQAEYLPQRGELGAVYLRRFVDPARSTCQCGSVGCKRLAVGIGDLLPTRAADFRPDLECLVPGSSMLGGSDMIAPELEQVVDLIVGRQEALRLAGRFELLHLPPLSPPCGTD